MGRLVVVLSLSVVACTLSGCATCPEAGVLQETWTGLAGMKVSDLTESPKYAELPDEARIIAQFKMGGSGDLYGCRFTALLCPPQTGDYTFWLLSDNGGELWLSPDASPDNARRIAHVTRWVEPGEWDRQRTQRSKSIRLEAGKRYFIRALLKEDWGGDHLSVGWQGPGIKRQVIPAKYLRVPELSRPMKKCLARTARADRRLAKQCAQMERYWKSGRTVPLALAEQFPLQPQLMGPADSGINVMVDHAHQTAFAMLWGLSHKLRGLGFRSTGNQATLDTVLTPGKLGRVRITVKDTFPFAWWRLPEFNVVITYQEDPNAQEYLPEEREALKAFVERGGGLIVMGTAPRSKGIADAWSLNKLARVFGASYTPQRVRFGRGTAAVLTVGKEWEVLARGEGGKPVRARRTFGKGRVVVLEGLAAFVSHHTAPADEKKAVDAFTKGTVAWAAAGKAPAGGEARLPTEMAGGGGIYPELEQNLGGVVLYYARNQKPGLLKAFREELPKAQKKIYEWLPSKKPEQPMYIIASAGGGGGWACNYLPKENGIIMLSPRGIVGVFGHELAHTLGGPPNAYGRYAGHSPLPNQGEEHAGWFQGKIDAWYAPIARNMPLRNCRNWPKGKHDWNRWSYNHWWWVWQKLDDRYGTTWYPRWYWVRNTRWKDDPGHRETWDELVEDMSIAVGEDLFPFFRKLGCTLKRERLATIVFEGETLALPVADIGLGPAGNVRLDPPGDYTKPLPSPEK